MSASALPTPAHSVNGTSQNDVTMSDESPQKRKRAADDSGDRDLKKMNLEGHKLDISELHRDVGSKYLLCQSRKAPFAAHFRRFSPLAATSRILTVVGHVSLTSLVLTVS